MTGSEETSAGRVSLITKLVVAKKKVCSKQYAIFTGKPLTFQSKSMMSSIHVLDG